MARFAKTVAITSWGGAVVACLAHNQEVGGSSPPLATFSKFFKMMMNIPKNEQALQHRKTMALEGGKGD